jgi:hypothetical protein
MKLKIMIRLGKSRSWKIHMAIIVALILPEGRVYADTSPPDKTVQGNVVPDNSVPEKAEEKIDYKLTLSHYSTQTLHANDINLRAKLDNQTGWLGFYKEGPSGFEQLRAGYEHTGKVLSADVVTSVQVASHGFLGMSINATLGETFFGLLGYGRTNLKPYANLNFDPNDAFTIGLGWHKTDGPSITLFMVRDDRVIPGEQIGHLTLRSPLPNQQRITLDIFHKDGSADQGQSIRGTGASLSYDWPRVFLHVAYDPKVNFSQENMVRVSLGMWF